MAGPIPLFTAIDPSEIVQAVNDLIQDVNDQLTGGIPGSGNVSNSGTPSATQVAVWTDATHIQGTSSLSPNVFDSGTGAAPSTYVNGDGEWSTPLAALITRGGIALSTTTPETFIVSGFSTVGDRGFGATYTSVLATPSGTMAIQNAAGTWYNLVTNRAANPGWFGAAGDGVTDDTIAIQAAINSTGNCYVPPGTYIVSNLLIPSYTTFKGSGKGQTIFKQKANSTGPVIALAAVYTTFIDIGGFTVDGNKTAQTAANIGIDINSNTTGTNIANNDTRFGLQDPRIVVDNVMVLNCKGSVFRHVGKGAASFSRILSMLCDGHGIEVLGFDSDWSNIDSGGAGLCGFYFNGSCASNRFSNIKSWYSGQIDRATYGQGFLFDGAFDNTFSNIETQNSGSEGIKMINANRNMMATVRIEFPPNPANTCNGMRLIDSNRNTIRSLSITDKTTPAPYSLDYSISLEKITVGCVGNLIDVYVGNAQQGLTIQVTGGQTLLNNDIYQNTAYRYISNQNWGYIPKYANDAAAAAGGIAVGGMYWSSVTGALQMRLV